MANVPVLVPGVHMGFLPFKGEAAKTANYTLSGAPGAYGDYKDAGILFTNEGAVGAVTFTLPAIRPNFLAAFWVVADQNVTIASAEGDNMVAFNDNAADSVAFSTAGQKVGGGVIIHSNQAGTKWRVQNISAGANTITVAT